MNDSTLFDPGLQPERTELAWRRSALAIGVGSLVAMRVLPTSVESTEIGVTVAITLGVLGIGFATLLWALARRRYRRVTRALTAPRTGVQPGAGMLLMLTVFVVLTGFVLALAAIWIAVGRIGG